MFLEKTIEEFEAMTAKEQAEYLVSKRTHEAEELEKRINQAVEDAKKGGATKEEVESLEKKQAEIIKELENLGLQNKALLERISGGTTVAEKSSLVEFVEKRVKKLGDERKNAWESVVVKAAALMTTANVTPNVANGFNQLFGNYVDPVIHSAPKRDVFILQLVDTQLASGTENIWYVERVNLEGDAQFIAEGALKPLIDGEYAERKADVKEVAERWKQSRRLINHAPSVVADFRTHANELISLKIDDGVLNGDGTGNNLNGVATLASPFIVPTGLANFYSAPNIFDAIMAVATYVHLNNFKGQLTCVLNTVWKAKMFGEKEATTNNYILPSFVAPDGSSVGDVNIVFQNGMNEDSILLGDLKRFKVRISENITYAEGYENDDFSKNLESRKLEAFLGTYLPANYAGAIIYDDIATVLTAIEKP
jgi:HK97 family phage major capsid protein